jgi:restriction endonuclease Mrr
MNDEKVRIHLWMDVKIIADEGKEKLGYIYVWEGVNSREWKIEIKGRPGWFSSADPEMEMHLKPTDFKYITKGYYEYITVDLQNSKFKKIRINFKNDEDMNKCYNVFNNMIENYKEQMKLREKLRERFSIGDLPDISPGDFERLIKELFEREGYTISHVGRGGVEGIDLFGKNKESGRLIVIQCKRYKGVIGTPLLRNFIGAIAADKYLPYRGIFVTTSSYSKDAKILAGKSNIELIDGEQLLTLLKKYY